MNTTKIKHPIWRNIPMSFTLVAAVVATQTSFPTRLAASDHIDSPAIAQDRGSDIADTYAFLDPNDNSKVVLLMSTQGFIVSGEHFGQVIFDHNIRYRFEIENTGDAKPDLFLDVNYSPGVGRLTTQTAVISLTSQLKGVTPSFDANKPTRLRRGEIAFSAPTTIANQEPQPTPAPTPVVTTDAASGIAFFGGAADDPFFLDDTGANRFVASSIANPGNPDKTLFGARGGRDTYAGFNTLITAVSIPVALLRGNTNETTNSVIGINFVTQRKSNQRIQKDTEVRGSGPYLNVDRQGVPLVNNGLIPASRKNEYNGATPADDAKGRFRSDIIKSLQNLGTDQAHIDMILAIAVNNGDILRVDLNVPNTGPGGGDNVGGGYGNNGGRRLKDDVVDGTFTIINNGVLLTDFVDGNEVPFRDTFPFVADPTQPFPPGLTPDDHTRQ
ncbi:MAG: DUF4331 family protein [Verrucomicrobiota bacterium]